MNPQISNEIPLELTKSQVKKIISGEKTDHEFFLSPQPKGGKRIKLIYSPKWCSATPYLADDTVDEDPGLIANHDEWECPFKDYQSDVPKKFWVKETFTKNMLGDFIYAADGEYLVCSVPTWIPARAMPKVACRIWLEITDVDLIYKEGKWKWKTNFKLITKQEYNNPHLVCV